MTDLELIRQARSGNRSAEDELIRRYRPLAVARTRGLYLSNGDWDDLEQVALLGLLKAIRTFCPERGASFRTFADICVRGGIAVELRRANRPRQRVVNEAGRDGALEHVTASTLGPDGVLEELEEVRRIVRGFGRLSELEQRALRLSLNGVRYGAGVRRGEKLPAPARSIDNALQRARRKLRAAA